MHANVKKVLFLNVKFFFHFQAQAVDALALKVSVLQPVFAAKNYRTLAREASPTGGLLSTLH